MTPATFRRLALSFPEAAEGSHMSHPDLRVGGRIFATLTRGDGDAEGVLKLSARQQTAAWLHCNGGAKQLHRNPAWSKYGAWPHIAADWGSCLL